MIYVQVSARALDALGGVFAPVCYVAWLAGSPEHWTCTKFDRGHDKLDLGIQIAPSQSSVFDLAVDQIIGSDRLPFEVARTNRANDRLMVITNAANFSRKAQLLGLLQTSQLAGEDIVVKLAAVNVRLPKLIAALERSVYFTICSNKHSQMSL